MNADLIVLFAIWTPLALIANVIVIRVWRSETRAVQFRRKLEVARSFGVYAEGCAAAAVGADLMALALLLASALPLVEDGSFRLPAMILATLLVLGVPVSAVVIYTTARWGRPEWAIPPALRRPPATPGR